ncbi:hypothetical protein ABK040_004244 [Willaertia magna]
MITNTKHHFLLLCFIVISFLLAFIKSSESSLGIVLELDDNNFESTISNNPNKPYFIKFYAPWCGHCKTLSPVWTSMAKELEHLTTITPNVQLAKVNCDDNFNTCRKYGVRGYPTLKLFYKGQVTEFHGYRTNAKLKSYLEDILSTSKSNGQLIDITTYEFDSKLKNRNRDWLIMFYSVKQQDSCKDCQVVKSEFENIAEKVKNTNLFVGKVNCETEKEICEKFKLTTNPKIIVFLGSSQKMNIYKAKELSTDHLINFIEKSRTLQMNNNNNENTLESIPSLFDNGQSSNAFFNFILDHPYISVSLVTVFCVAICGVFLAILCMSDEDDHLTDKKYSSDIPINKQQQNKQELLDQSVDNNKEDDNSPATTTTGDAFNKQNLKERKHRVKDE